MKTRRRILLQLTPLLDLLMTILFVQYILLQNVSTEAVSAKVQTEDTLRLSREIEESLRSQNDALAKERNELRNELEKVNKQLEEVQLSQRTSEEQVKETTKNLERIGNLTKEMFSISEESFQSLTANLNPNQTERIREELEHIKDSSSSQALEELMKLDELRKRCDFYKVHITYDGFVILEVNEEEKGRFYVQSSTSPEKVRDEFFKISNEISEPKSIVLVIMTHGNAIKGVVDLTKKGLNKFIQEKQNKEYSRSRYEFSDWGYVPDSK